MSLFPSLCNFYNGQISTPLCSCPLACFGKSEKEEEREREREKKCPDEYTASQEDLLIGGSLSPSVVELRPNPSRRLNETVQIPRDGPRQQLLEWVGRMRSERERKRKAGPPPTVHAPSSHLNQSRKPGWPCLLWSLSSETSTFRIKMISSGPPPKTPQHTHSTEVWLRFFFLANPLRLHFLSPPRASCAICFSLFEVKRLKRLPPSISTVLNRERSGIMCCFCFCPNSASKKRPQKGALCCDRAVTTAVLNPPPLPPRDQCWWREETEAADVFFCRSTSFLQTQPGDIGGGMAVASACPLAAQLGCLPRAPWFMMPSNRTLFFLLLQPRVTVLS